MKKIALNIETLSVESFEPGSALRMDRGTVEGNQGGTVNVACYTNQHSCQRTPCCPETTLC
jgi:hypothetical protein